jgi:DNA-binding protein HU-beta
MNTGELADKVAEEHNVDRAEAKRVVDTVLSTIAHAAGQGEEIALAGFGKFKVADRPARQGRNPATGQAMEIAASRKLAFSPAKQLRDRLNDAGKGGSGSARKSAPAKSPVKGRTRAKA